MPKFGAKVVDDFRKVQLLKMGKDSCTPPGSVTFSPPKNDGWKTILSFWDGIFSGAMLNFRGVKKKTKTKKHIVGERCSNATMFIWMVQPHSFVPQPVA